MTRKANAEARRTAAVCPRAALRPLAGAIAAALALLLLVLILPVSSAHGQRGGQRREAPRNQRQAPRQSAPRNEGRAPHSYPRNEGQATRPYSGRPAQNQQREMQRENRNFRQQAPYRQQAPMGSYGRGENFNRPVQPYANPRQESGGQGGASPRPAYPGAQRNGAQRNYERQYGRPDQPYGRPTAPGYGRPQAAPNPRFAQPNEPGYGRPAYPGGAEVRPAMPGRQPYSSPGAFPPGHLGSWLNQHRNMPVQGQEQMLRSDPSFRRLPQSDQQRLMQQLQQVDRLPQQQRDRRLERGELIERMSPQERMQLGQSSRELRNLPADRQTLVKHAFQDLSGVPIDQRQTVLQSERYRSMFSPEERSILGNLLRAEPYDPSR